MSDEGNAVLTVRAGGRRVAFPASIVAEVIRTPPLTRVPNGPASLLGVTHLRGMVLPVLSLGQLVHRPEASGSRGCVVVLSQRPALGLAVDAVESLGAGAEDDGATWLDIGDALDGRFAFVPRKGEGQISQVVAPSAAAAPERDLAFLAFVLAGQDYALPLEAVAEVMALPPAIASLPMTDDLLLGVFTLREAVLPVLSLRLLLGLEAHPLSGKQQVVVTKAGEHQLALVVDRITGILRVGPDRVAPAPSLFNRGGGEARIADVLRLPDGRGIAAVLSPGGILSDDRVLPLVAAPLVEEEATMPTPVTPQAHGAARERFVMIRLGTESYGLPIGAVDEVVRLPEVLTRLPKAPPYVRGVMNRHGRVVPVIDQRQRFGVADSGDEAGRPRVVVVTIGRLQAGFAVDAVAGILEAGAEDILPAPAMEAGRAALFDRAVAVQRDGRLILLIDPTALLTLAEADLLRDLVTAPASP